MKRIVFRADGNSKIGLGHIYRSLALAEMLAQQYRTVFITKNDSFSIRKLVESICDEYILFDEYIDIESDVNRLYSLVNKSDIVVLDGYHFDTKYQTSIKPRVRRLVSIDDIHNCHFVSDVVINHAGGILPQDYFAENYTKFYLGLKYALLSKPFRDASKCKSYPERKEGNIFICLGGADPKNDLLRVLEYCEDIERIKLCYVVVGNAYEHLKELEGYLRQSSLVVKLFYAISSTKILNIMKLCPMAITSPSTIAYEYLSVGGGLFLKVIADNQKKMYNFFIEENLAFPLDDLKKNHVKTIKSYDLDGLQKERFLSLFDELFL